MSMRSVPTCRAAALIAAAVLLAARPVASQPLNDACAAATPVTMGVPVIGSLLGATSDGAGACSLGTTPDVYHAFTPPVSGTYTFTLCTGTDWDSVISLHGSCPATEDNQVACDDDGCRPAGSTAFGVAASLAIGLPGGSGQTYIIRIAPFDATVAAGLYTLLIVGPAAPTGGCCFAGSCAPATPPVCAASGGTYRGDYTACIAPAGMTTFYAAPTGPLAIPDNTPIAGGVTSTINVPDSFTVGDVRLRLALSHDFAGDLTATLSHAGRNVTLFERIGGGYAGDDSDFEGVYAFSDAAFGTIWQAAVDQAPTTSSVIPTGPNRAADAFANTVSLCAAFTGLASAGEWTLSVSDNALFSTGVLLGWDLELDRAAGDPCDLSAGACCAGASCLVATVNACSGPQRRFVGPGSVCNAPGNLAQPCCKGDFNQVGGVTVQDVFDYLVAYFSGQPTADTNGGGLSVQDLFDFLVAYFAGCA